MDARGTGGGGSGFRIIPRRVKTGVYYTEDVYTVYRTSARCDVWARAHAMGGGLPKRPVATIKAIFFPRGEGSRQAQPLRCARCQLRRTVKHAVRAPMPPETERMQNGRKAKHAATWN